MIFSICGCRSKKNDLSSIKHETSKLLRSIVEKPEKYKSYLSNTQLEKIKNLNSVQKHALRQEVKIKVTNNDTPKMERYLKKELEKIKNDPSKILKDKKMIEYVESNKSKFVKKIMSPEMKTTEEQDISNRFFSFLKSSWKEVTAVVDIVLKILVECGTNALKDSIRDYGFAKYKNQIDKAIDHIGNKIHLIDHRITKNINQEEFQNGKIIMQRSNNDFKNDGTENVFMLGELE